MNGFGTIDKKDINVLISSIENRINFIRNDINQNVTSLKNQLNACTEELNRLKKLVIQVTNYNDSEYKKLENRINQFNSDIEDIKNKLNTIQYNEIASGKCASGINEYPIYAKYAENDTNGNIIPEYYAAKYDLSNASATLSADYTSKIAESSSGGMSALSSVSAQLHDSIENETNTLKSKDEELKSAIDNESTERISKDKELDDKIEMEISNRENEISGLQNLLKKEIERATDVEQDISKSLSKEIEYRTNAITELEGKIKEEETRATNAENELQSNIDSEATLRVSAYNEIKTNLSDEITRATGVETTLTNNLKSEISRALSAELQLDTKIDTNTNEIYDTISSISGHLSSSIISEYNDRVAADISLQNQIDTIEATQNVIDLVANYAALTAYDTTNVKVNDKIQVICDETSANQTTIYSWNNNTWNGIGMFGPYYTKSQVEEEITKAIDTEKTERESAIKELNTNKQNNLTAGAGIDLTNDTISVNTDIIATKESVANKKDKQEELTFNGSATKTVKKITQNVNGELNVEFADIDLPSQVPNVEITSEDNSVKVTETTDIQTNTKTFDLSVNGGSGGTTYSAGDAIDLTNDTISVKYSKGLELNNDNAIQVKVEAPLRFNKDTIGFIDAPIDNYSYVRNNGAWVPLPTSINDLIKRPSIISNDEEVYFVNHNSKYTYFKNAELSYPYYSINADIPCCIEMQSQNDLSKASNKIKIGLSEIELPKKLTNFACSSDRLFALATNDTVSFTVYEVDIATLEIVNIYDLSEYGTVYNINYSNGKVLIIGYKDNVRSVVDLFNSEVLYQGNDVTTCAAIINDNLLVFFSNNFLNVNTGKITSFDGGYVRFTVNDMYFSNRLKCYRITDEFELEVVSDNVYGVTYSFARNELLYITSTNLVIIDSYGNRTSYFNSNSKVENIFDMNSIIGAYGSLMFNVVS